jgi:hypothetical protein
MDLVWQLVCDGELEPAVMLRGKFLTKHQRQQQLATRHQYSLPVIQLPIPARCVPIGWLYYLCNLIGYSLLIVLCTTVQAETLESVFYEVSVYGIVAQTFLVCFY